MKYCLKVDWSPYSDGLIVFLKNQAGDEIANFRTVVDLPAARHPLLVCSGGGAQFENVLFDPTLDAWDLKWEWYKTPVLTPDVCNPPFEMEGWEVLHGLAQVWPGHIPWRGFFERRYSLGATQ